MGRTRFLPSTLRGRLALAAAIAIFYVLASTAYIRHYPSSFKPLKEDLGSAFGPPEVSPSPVEEDGTKKLVSSPPKILIVTSWFPVPKLQFTAEEYDQWLPHFFGTNANDIYLYTTPEFEEHLRSLRGLNLTITIDTSFPSPLDIPPLKGKADMYQKILKKDRAKSRRSIELYANRHAKPFFLYDAVSHQDKLGKTYDFAFWSDAGSFRQQHVFSDWPSHTRLQEVWNEASKLSSTPKQDFIFIPTSRAPHSSMSFWTEIMGPIDNDISIASFFGGMPHSLDWFNRVYYAYHDFYLSLEIFIGKNQALINTLLFLFPEHFITVWANDPDAPAHLALNRTKPEDSFLGQCGSNGHERFYYQFWLAGDSERKEMQDAWVKKASAWRWWGWWKSRDTTPCQTTRVIGAETILKNKLGEGWTAPHRDVKVPDTLGWSTGA